jgi:hypothetical protein
VLIECLLSQILSQVKSVFHQIFRKIVYLTNSYQASNSPN